MKTLITILSLFVIFEVAAAELGVDQPTDASPASTDWEVIRKDGGLLKKIQSANRTWFGGTISVAKGGTGQTSYTDGQLLIGNSSGNTLTKATLTGSTNQITITNGNGSITVGLADTLQVGSAGVLFSTDADGVLVVTGNGSGADENLKWNFDAVANQVGVSSSTGVTAINFGTIGLTSTGTGTITTVNATNFQIGGVAVTPSAAELNFVDGVTSAVQTQLDAKQGLTHSSANDPDISTEGHLSWDANGDWLRGYDGTNQVAVARKIEAIQCTVVLPNDLADSERDAFWVWSNESGMSFIVTGWKAWSDTDDTTLNIEEIDADGANNATVDAVEIATNGTGLFTGADTSITGATIENGHLLVLDFDDTDTPGQVKITIYGYFNADVN